MLYLRRMILIAAIALAALLVPAPKRSEAGELDSKVASLATKLATFLKDQSHTEVALNDIVGPPDPATNSGPGIQTRLIQELGKQSIKINQKAALIIEGKYRVIDDDDNKKEELIVRLILIVSNKSGRGLLEVSDELSFKGSGNDEIAKLLNMQVDLSEKTKATPQDRNQEMKKQLEKPPLHIDDCKVKTTDKSPYAVEVLVQAQGKGEFKPAVPKDKDGKGNAFIELKKGDVYRLRLHNNSKIEAVASVTIDGVDAFQFFEPEDKRPGSFLIAPTGTRDVKGWRRNTEKLNDFLVGSYSDSAAAKVLKSGSKLGTIVVCFHPAWQGKTPPKEYDGSRSIEPNGTGLGSERFEKTTVVKRTIGPLVASIAIRYNK